MDDAYLDVLGREFFAIVDGVEYAPARAADQTQIIVFEGFLHIFPGHHATTANSCSESSMDQWESRSGFSASEGWLSDSAGKGEAGAERNGIPDRAE